MISVLLKRCFRVNVKKKKKKFHATLSPYKKMFWLVNQCNKIILYISINKLKLIKFQLCNIILSNQILEKVKVWIFCNLKLTNTIILCWIIIIIHAYCQWSFHIYYLFSFYLFSKYYAISCFYVCELICFGSNLKFFLTSSSTLTYQDYTVLPIFTKFQNSLWPPKLHYCFFLYLHTRWICKGWLVVSR